MALGNGVTQLSLNDPDLCCFIGLLDICFSFTDDSANTLHFAKL